MSNRYLESGREDSQQNMGRLIARRRKEQQMTQKELAARLHITDKAVSKWERGLSCPDISILAPLAQELGITTSQLLNGEAEDMQEDETAVKKPDIENKLDQAVEKTLVYAQQAEKRKAGSLQTVSTLIFTGLLLLGMIVCMICDLAVSGAFTWSWYPVSAILFAWLVTVPVMRLGKRGLKASLAAGSVLIFPFLYILQLLVDRDVPGKGRLLLPIGGWTALFSVGFLWLVFALFHVYSSRRWKALGISLAAAMPFSLLINLTVYHFTGEPWMDIWDLFTYVPLAALTLLAVWQDQTAGRKNGK